MTLWAILIGFIGMLGIAAAFNPLRALALAKDVGAFLLDKARAAVKWARDPARNWWKIGCVSLASFCAILSWYADSQRRTVNTVRTESAAAIVKVQAEAGAARQAANTNRENLLRCQAMLELEVGLRQETERLNREAVAAAQAVATQARDDLEKFRKRQKSPSCSTALTAVEAACANFSDY